MTVAAVRGARLVWRAMGVGVAAVGLAEVLARGLRQRRQQEDPRGRADGYQHDGAVWAPDFYREWRLMCTRFRWHPYSYWRPGSFRGRYLNIDSEGIRRTWSSGGPDEQRQSVVLTFGGSTMWGEGVRDEHTIASVLARRLAEEDVRVSVRNCGQIGYVSTQAVISLQMELSRGTRPRVVVFYDGYNDVLAPLGTGSAGLSYKEWHREQEFNLRTRTAALAAAMFRSLAVSALVGIDLNKPPPQKRSPANDERLAEEIAARYVANVAIVRALGAAFGFQPVFCWQPTIFHKDRLTRYEHQQADTIRGAQPLLLRVYHLIRTHPSLASSADFHDLAEVFRECPQPYYVDAAHLTESGNSHVAEAMLPAIRTTLDAGRAPGSPS